MFKKTFIHGFLILFTLIFLTPLKAKTQEILAIALTDPLDSPAGEYALKFKELIEEKTQGQTIIEIYPNSLLGELESLQSVRRGTLDMCIILINNATPLVPTLGALTLPFFFRSREAVVKATTGKLFHYFNNKAILEGRVRILGYTYAGFSHFTNSKHPVRTILDAKGLKIAISSSRISMATCRALGAFPIPILLNTVYEALESKEIDGASISYMRSVATEIYKVQPYLTETPSTYALQPLFISEQKFASFTPELQEILLSSAQEAQEHVLHWQRGRTAAAKAILEEAGVTIDVLSDEEVWIEKISTEVWPQLYPYIGGKEIVDMVLKEIENINQ